LYGEEATDRTYKVLEELCETVARAGWAAIVDATFTKLKYREPYRLLAKVCEI